MATTSRSCSICIERSDDVQVVGGLQNDMMDRVVVADSSLKNPARRAVYKGDHTDSPSTPPSRAIPSSYSTPGSTYGKEEDAIVIELTPRYIKAGFEGQSSPQSYHEFTPSDLLRHGDFRLHMPGYAQPREDVSKWGQGYELWLNDLRAVDLDIMTSTLERVMRDVYNKDLLVDAGNARLVLVLPSLVPHPALERMLQTFFGQRLVPSVMLLPASACALVAAGLRSGLVIDIGWEESVFTILYELREVKVHRTTRGLKSLTRRLAEQLQNKLDHNHRLDVRMIEELLRRTSMTVFQQDAEGEMEIDWPTDTFTKPVRLSLSGIRGCVEESLLDMDLDEKPDDHDIPVHVSMYNALANVQQDVRALCLARIVFTGLGSEMDGIDHLILDRFRDLVKQRGWNIAFREALTSTGRAVGTLNQGHAQSVDAHYKDIMLSGMDIPEERYLRDKYKGYSTGQAGLIRQISTLGSWAGASLLTSLQVKSMVELQRDRFLTYGLNGASRQADITVVAQKRMSTLGLRPKLADRTSWTLSGFG